MRRPFSLASSLILMLSSGLPQVAAQRNGSTAVDPADSIRASRIFEEPLVPVGKAPKPLETQALEQALQAYRATGDNEAVGPFLDYLRSYPASPWNASLRCNLGALYRWKGYYTRALEAWEAAFTEAQAIAGPEAKQIADRALGDLVLLNARLGRMDRLAALLKIAEARSISGSPADRIQSAREGLWLMENHPETSFRCGPYALGAILGAKGGHPNDPRIERAASNREGTSLFQNLVWSKGLGLELRAAKRVSGAEFPVPSLIHWKTGHFAAVVKQSGDRFLVQDPTFGAEVWLTRKALDAEASGFALVPESTLASAWQPLDQAQASLVWGKGATGDVEGHGCVTTPCGGKSCWASSGSGGGPGGPPPPAGDPPPRPGEASGMAVHVGYIPSASLGIIDTPLGYEPPRGPAIFFTFSYYQRETYQPQTFAFGNVGQRWSHSWQSYVKDDPSVIGQTAYVLSGINGEYIYTGFDSASQSYAPQLLRHDILVRTGASSYELRKNDGSKHVFTASDGAAAFPRRIFLSQVVDPSGNAATLAYDSSFRLVSVTDAIGQVTTLQYAHPTDPLKVTSVTDPFGRTATLTYNAAGLLAQIEDIIGLKSQFAYGPTPECPAAPADFLSSLTTPYGTHTFLMGQTSNIHRWLEAKDPFGARERWEFREFAPGIASTEPYSVPGFWNFYLDKRNSFFWDKRAMAEAPGDYTKARIHHWLLSQTGGIATVILESEKAPLESRVWYNYPGQVGSSTHVVGTDSLPRSVGRRLDDGTFQISQYEYNSLGKVTKATDPAGRQVTYVYDTNKIDLLEVRNTTGGVNERVAQYTYNSQHKPLTATDSAGQVTTFAYNPFGQALTVTNPKGETTSMVYDSAGYLASITGPVLGSTTAFTYDGYGRPRTVTGPDGQTVTTDYDTFNRPTKVTHPDGSTTESVYDRLDLWKSKDQKGRWTTLSHNPLRQLVEVEDAQGRVTRFDWCGCGSQMESLTDPMGRITQWVRDLQGRVVAKVLQDNTQTTYAYDGASRLAQRRDAKGQYTNYLYFADNALKQVSYPNAQKATPTVSYTYDGKYNRLATMTDGIGTTQYGYWPITVPPVLGAGRLATVDGPWANDTITYQYDALGRVVSRDIAGSAETRLYDLLGRVSSVSNALGTFTYTYDGLTSRLKQVDYPNGQKTKYTNDGPEFRLKTIENLKSDNSNISTFGYTYDLDGQIKTWSQAADAQAPKTYTFDYDAVNQLTGAVLNGPNGELLRQYSYGYDLMGNRTSEGVDGATTTATFNNTNQLTGQRYSLNTAAIKVQEDARKAQKAKAEAEKAKARPSAPKTPAAPAPAAH